MERSFAKRKAIILWGQHKNLREIGDIVGYSHETVRKMLKEARVKVKRRAKPKKPVQVRHCTRCEGKLEPGRRKYCASCWKEIKNKRQALYNQRWREKNPAKYQAILDRAKNRMEVK